MSDCADELKLDKKNDNLLVEKYNDCVRIFLRLNHLHANREEKKI